MQCGALERKEDSGETGATRIKSVDHEMYCPSVQVFSFHRGSWLGAFHAHRDRFLSHQGKLGNGTVWTIFATVLEIYNYSKIKGLFFLKKKKKGKGNSVRPCGVPTPYSLGAHLAGPLPNPAPAPAPTLRPMLARGRRELRVLKLKSFWHIQFLGKLVSTRKWWGERRFLNCRTLKATNRIKVL